MASRACHGSFCRIAANGFEPIWRGAVKADSGLAAPFGLPATRSQDRVFAGFGARNRRPFPL